MDRRRFLISAAAGATAPAPAVPVGERPPRKVVVGTMMQGFWEPYPGLRARVDRLTGFVDRIAQESQRKYGRNPDLVVLPEVALTGEAGNDIVSAAQPFEGMVRESFAAKAREHGCYIVVPMYLLEDRAKRIGTNVAILMGRKGEVVGTYRKVHLAISPVNDSLEGGATPGKTAPVFECDFGKLGLQICFDMNFESGWNELQRQGAELVAWPTQSPQTSQPAGRARRGRCYIVSSTWRQNASLFEPTGKIAAQLKKTGEVMVEEIDLSYTILPWSPGLRNGAAVREKYGDRAGFRYYDDEDLGIFWSNDPAMPVAAMARALGLENWDQYMARVGRVFRRAGIPG
jgi:predicted amidohydrolase